MWCWVETPLDGCSSLCSSAWKLMLFFLRGISRGTFDRDPRAFERSVLYGWYRDHHHHMALSEFWFNLPIQSRCVARYGLNPPTYWRLFYICKVGANINIRRWRWRRHQIHRMTPSPSLQVAVSSLFIIRASLIPTGCPWYRDQPIMHQPISHGNLFFSVLFCSSTELNLPSLRPAARYRPNPCHSFKRL